MSYATIVIIAFTVVIWLLLAWIVLRTAKPKPQARRMYDKNNYQLFDNNDE